MIHLDGSAVNVELVDDVGSRSGQMVEQCLTALMANVRMLEGFTRKTPIPERSLAVCLRAGDILHRIGGKGLGKSSRGGLKHGISAAATYLDENNKLHGGNTQAMKIDSKVLDAMTQQKTMIEPKAIVIRRDVSSGRSLIASAFAGKDGVNENDEKEYFQQKEHHCHSSSSFTKNECNQTAEASTVQNEKNETKEQDAISAIIPTPRAAFRQSFMLRKEQHKAAASLRALQSERKDQIVGRLRSAIHAIGMARYFKTPEQKVIPEIPGETESQRFLRSQQRLRRERNALINSLLDEAIEFDTAWIIHPGQPELLAWNALLVLLWILTLLAIPLAFGFQAVPPSGLIFFVDASFIFDIGIGLITGYIDGPLICMNSKKVARRYLHTWFIWDLIAAVPFGALCFLYPKSEHSKRSIFYFLELVKSIKVPRLNREVIRPLTERAIDCHMISRVTLGLLQILAWFGMILHWLGCCYWSISHCTEPEWNEDHEYTAITWEKTAAYKRGFCPHYTLHNRYVSRKWLASIHWAAYATYSGLPLRQGTIPLKTVQSTFQTLCLMLGMLVLASTIGAVGAVIDELRGGDRHKQDMLNELDHFFTVRNVPEDVRITIRRYILFLHERRILTSSSPTKQILSQLPSELRSHVIGGAKFSYLKAPGQFYALFDDNFLRVVSYRMCTAIYHPLQIACSQGEPCAGVQYVAKGSVLLFVRSQPWPKALRFLEHNETFGEEIFLLDRTDSYLDDEEPECLYSAVARDFTEVFLLRYADLVELRGLYPKFRKVFDNIANQSRNALCFEVATKVLRNWCKKHVQGKKALYAASSETVVAASMNEHATKEITITSIMRNRLTINPHMRKKNVRNLNNRLAPFGTVAVHENPNEATAKEYS